MSEQAVRGIVIAHGGLAAAMIEAVTRIAGPDLDALSALSNEGLGPPEIRSRLDAMVGDGPAIVFADLREGSCGNAARQVCYGGANRALVTGVNLPVLLDFVMHRDMALDALARRLVDRGRSSITTNSGKA